MPFPPSIARDFLAISSAFSHELLFTREIISGDGLHGGDRIPQFQVSRTEKDSGLVGSTIYYDFEEY